MKKLRLKALSLGAREILSREQLKAITGGCTSDSQCGSGICNSSSVCVGGSGPGSGHNYTGSGQAVCYSSSGTDSNGNSCTCSEEPDGNGGCKMSSSDCVC